MSPSVNHSGLKPEESKGLPTRQTKGDEEGILKAIKELYTCSPNESSYSIYSTKAIFHDPIGYAKGLDEIKSQFNGLPKLFNKSTIDRFKLLQNPSGLEDNTILIDQDVTYYFKESPSKTVNSLVTLQRDSKGLVTEHFEEWDHKRESDSSDGFFGMLSQARKTLTAKLTGALVSPDTQKI